MRRTARGYLLVVSALNGFAGLLCGLLFVARPDGALLQAGALRPVIGRLPLAGVFFADFRWIGIAMLLVLGIPNALTLWALLGRGARQYALASATAVLLMAWTGFELVFMFNVAALGYFVAGAVSLVASVFLIRQPDATGR